MENNFEYPIDMDWEKEEIVQVVELWHLVALAYEAGVNREQFLEQYKLFKQVVPSKGEEKRWGNRFEERSGYSLYRVVKAAKENQQETIHLKS